MRTSIRAGLSVLLLLVSSVAAGADAPGRKPAASGHGALGPLGLGIVFGEPTGITAKLWQGSQTAIDVGLAYSLSSFGLIYADHLWHFKGWIPPSSAFLAQLSPYLGIGGELFFGSSGRKDYKWSSKENGTFGIGMRFPIGVEWRPLDPPLGVFLELVPGVGVIPGLFGFFNGGIGFRYYF